MTTYSILKNGNFTKLLLLILLGYALGKNFLETNIQNMLP